LYHEPGWQRLVDALERLGVSYSVHKVIPFVGDLDPDPTDLPDGPKIVMGSYSMAFFAQRKGWLPGSFSSPRLDFVQQLPRWGKRMLNWDSKVYRLEEVPEQKVPFFIRPTLDSKSFTGYVTNWAAFLDWRKDMLLGTRESYASVTADTLVQVCSTKIIYREYRLWVVNGKVVTASLYKEGSRVLHSDRADPAIVAYGEEVARVWSPEVAYVLDICDTPEGLRVLEAGCMNAAGFYAADMQKLVMALEDAFSGGSKETPQA